MKLNSLVWYLSLCSSGNYFGAGDDAGGGGGGGAQVICYKRKCEVIMDGMLAVRKKHNGGSGGGCGGSGWNGVCDVDAALE